jgi:hypothetical protein
VELGRKPVAPMAKMKRRRARNNPMSLVGVRPDKPWTTGEYIALGLVGIGAVTIGYLVWQQQAAASAAQTASASSTSPASTSTTSTASTTAQTPAPGS